MKLDLETVHISRASFCADDTVMDTQCEQNYVNSEVVDLLKCALLAVLMRGH